MKKNLPVMCVLFNQARQEILIKHDTEGVIQPFSDAIDVYAWGATELGIAIISFDNERCQYMALARKGKRVVTSKNRIGFSSLIDLGGILTSDIDRLTNNHIWGRFTRESTGFSPVTLLDDWQAVIAAIKKLRPYAAREIDRLVSLSQYSGYSLTGAHAEILLQEREALGAALDIFSRSSQLRQQVLGEWAPDPEMVTNVDNEEKTATLEASENLPAFIRGIPERYINEESAIQHDLYNWIKDATHELGVACFKQGDRSLSIFYANKNRLEKCLGVDLIYYDEKFELFVLVQYKLMRDEAYRPDKQMMEELSRMDDAYWKLRLPAGITSEIDYRLNDDGFMFKLVPNKGLTPASGELIKGMYVPREYMHFLVSEHGPKGSRGGTRITFENAGRYLTNTQFTGCVQSGWIGFRGIQSEKLKAVLKDFIQGSRQLMLAYASSEYYE